MKNIIRIFNILLISLIIYNFYNTIEPYCNPELSQGDKCKSEYEQTIYTNDENIDRITSKISSLKKKLKNIGNSILGNAKNTNKNANTLEKMKKLNTGEEIDNSEACEKHPEAC